MRRSSTLLLGAVATAAAALTTALPASAATTGTTTATFNLTGGSLDISVPANAEFGDFPVTNTNVGGPLGTVSVTDTRGIAGATWTASLATTGFVSAGNQPVVPPENITYDPGTISATNVTATGTPRPALSADPQVIVQGTGGTGVNIASWSGQVNAAIPPTANVAGTLSAQFVYSIA